MFGTTSRYVSLAVKTLDVLDSDGQTRQIRYVERRFLPPSGSGPTVVEHMVIQGDRLDNITAKYLGDPTQFWRVADANEAMRPEELTDDIGQRIRIALSSL
jgi:hypothetical protein